MLFVICAIKPIRGVHSDPPIMAITRIDPPTFVFSPNPLILEAKIVGYINDIKKLVKKIAHIPIQPGIRILNPTNIILIMLYQPISRLGLKYSINQVA